MSQVKKKEKFTSAGYSAVLRRSSFAGFRSGFVSKPERRTVSCPLIFFFFFFFFF